MSTVGVVGAGAMGAGIAQVAAVAGDRVLLLDARAGAAAGAAQQITARLDRLVAKDRMSRPAADEAAARLSTADEPAQLSHADLVVEAIVEDLAAKRALFAELERVCRAEALLTTNTSTLSVTDIAAELEDPSRVCGMHFFNPAPLMQLVEVPRGTATADEVVDRVVEFATRWGKTAVRCTSTPGFIVNRVARPFYSEAQLIVEEGIADIPTVDAALRGLGFRMGPFELADLIGNDVNLTAATSVWEQTGRDPRYTPTESQRQLVAKGRFGRKTSRGWYDYADGKPVVEQPAEPDAELAATITDRVVAMLVNEAAALVDRGEALPEAVDSAMRLGTNYPFGPLEHGDEWGAQRVLEILRSQAARDRSGRYRPAERLLKAAAGEGTLR